MIDISVDCFLTKVESNSSDVFSEIGSWIKHEMAIFVFFIISVVLIPLGSPVISDDINIVSSCFNSNKFD